jgi:hypothetical protein
MTSGENATNKQVRRYRHASQDPTAGQELQPDAAIPKSNQKQKLPERGASHFGRTVQRLDKHFGGARFFGNPLDNQARAVYEHRPPRYQPNFSSIENEKGATFQHRRHCAFAI